MSCAICMFPFSLCFFFFLFWICLSVTQVFICDWWLTSEAENRFILRAKAPVPLPDWTPPKSSWQWNADPVHCIICAPFRGSWPVLDMGVNNGNVLWCLNLQSRSQWFMSSVCECACLLWTTSVYLCILKSGCVSVWNKAAHLLLPRLLIWIKMSTLLLLTCPVLLWYDCNFSVPRTRFFFFFFSHSKFRSFNILF